MSSDANPCSNFPPQRSNKQTIYSRKGQPRDQRGYTILGNRMFSFARPLKSGDQGHHFDGRCTWTGSENSCCLATCWITKCHFMSHANIQSIGSLFLWSDTPTWKEDIFFAITESQLDRKSFLQAGSTVNNSIQHLTKLERKNIASNQYWWHAANRDWAIVGKMIPKNKNNLHLFLFCICMQLRILRYQTFFNVKKKNISWKTKDKTRKIRRRWSTRAADWHESNQIKKLDCNVHYSSALLFRVITYEEGGRYQR